MYDYTYMIYAFVKFLDEPPVIICLSRHPGLWKQPQLFHLVSDLKNTILY